MQSDRAAKREDRDGASNATKHAHETRERLPLRQSIARLLVAHRAATAVFLRFPVGVTS
jgi:hypothetical protein